jgi:toxin ParE1/3/4
MPRVRISRRAEVDFDELIDYLTGVAGKGIAGKYGRAIQASINRTAEFPGIGSPRPALGLGTRVVMVRPFLIFYEVAEDDSVLVLRILHGHRNITRDLLRPQNSPGAGANNVSGERS